MGLVQAVLQGQNWASGENSACTQPIQGQEITS